MALAGGTAPTKVAKPQYRRGNMPKQLLLRRVRVMPALDPATSHLRTFCATSERSGRGAEVCAKAHHRSGWRRRTSAAASGLLLASTMAACSATAGAADGFTTARPPWQAASIWPDRVIATLAENPQTSFSVTWRTDATVTRPVAQIAPASADARFDLAATSYRAQTSALPLDHFEVDGDRFPIIENHDLPAVHDHNITFRDLAPGTAYAWRVRGAAGAWTPWRHLQTAPASGPVRVLYFGDAQRGIRSHVTRVFDAARAAAPDASFAIHGGDLVNTANHDREWAEWHEALGTLHHVIPALPVPGNHDYVNLTKLQGAEGDDKLFVARRTVTPLWRAQFTLPIEESVPSDLAETVYDVRYTQDLHVFALDSSGVAWLEQLAWLERALADSDARWRVLVMHHPIFSHIGGREHPAHAERRRTLVELLRAQDVDLVLAGHRHTYQRAEMGEDVARFQAGDARDVQTVFLVTAASAARGRTSKAGRATARIRTRASPWSATQTTLRSSRSWTSRVSV